MLMERVVVWHSTSQASLTSPKLSVANFEFFLWGYTSPIPPICYGWRAHLQNLARQFFRAQFYNPAGE